MSILRELANLENSLDSPVEHERSVRAISEHGWVSVTAAEELRDILQHVSPEVLTAPEVREAWTDLVNNIHRSAQPLKSKDRRIRRTARDIEIMLRRRQ